MADHDPTDLRAQERTAANVAEEERLAREKEQNDLRWVMGTKQGRRFVWRLLERAGVFRSSFNTNNAVMAFQEGGRNNGLMLLTDVTGTCPDNYDLMQKEHREEKENYEHRVADRRNKRK